ncbi:MAG TPA: hypothetical protein PLG77_01985 [Burkholderiaceae bacterium]|nr:hypothetical protein [Burkholderiaceae bacterium]HRP27184.1 hypothetical protein [Burkholderiaceae bacterium]
MAEALRAGSFASDGDGSLAALIEDAMREEWQAARGEPLPTSGPGVKDRRILFAAVAKGVLRYLYEHRDDLITTLEINEGSGNHRHEAAFDLVEKL